MDTIKANYKWVIALVVTICFIIFLAIEKHKVKKLQNELNSEKQTVEYYKTLDIARGIETQKLLREEREKYYQYRDSIRQEKINYITIQNEKSRKQTSRTIKLLPNSTSEYRDSLWTSEFAKKDTFPY